MTSPTDRITINGKTLTRRVWGLLADARAAAGLPAGGASVMQGSFNKGVSASAGTHDAGGAFDLSIAGLTEAEQINLVTELRRRNACSWIRSKRYGWNGAQHIHGIVRDEPALSAQARAQVVAYDNKRNGLANRGPDPHPRPKQFPTEKVAAMTDPKPYIMIKREKKQTIKLNTWVKLDIDDAKDWVLPPVGANDWDAYVNLDFNTLTGALRNDLRYILGRWARHDAASPDAIEGGLDVTGADTKAIPADLPKRYWRSTWTHGFKGEKNIPVSFWVYIGATKDGAVVSPLRIFKVDDET